MPGIPHTPIVPGIMEHIHNISAVGKAAAAVGVAGLALDALAQEGLKMKQIHDTRANLVNAVPELAEVDPQKINDYFDVVKLYSPQAARNPLVAGNLIHKMNQFNGVDHGLIRDIGNIQSESDLGGNLQALMKYSPAGAFNNGNRYLQDSEF